MIKISMTVGLSLLLLACSFGGKRTLGDLEYKPQQEKPIEFDNMNYQEVRQEYQELLSLFKDDELKEQIERRIADVFMLEGGEDQLKATPKTKSYYADAIKSYQEILDKYPNSPDNADVLYQLARAYDMDGHTDEALKRLTQLTQRHPNYKNIAEAHFRIADIYFNRQKYRLAQSEFLIVAKLEDPKLTSYSHYMLGWTYYKQYNYPASVKSYATVLERLLVNDVKLGELNNTERPLVEEAIQSMSLALARNGGAELIENIPSLNGKHYLWRIYDSLGEYFLEKQRYEDSANTFRQFVRRYNFSAHAPVLHSKLISTYIKGGFPLQALSEKEVYVEYYSLTSQYAATNNGINDQIKSQLKVYFDELASHYHSKAQSLVKLHEKQSKQITNKNDEKLAEINRDYTSAFKRAAHFYAQYIITFPQDERIPEFSFLKAEAHLSALEYPTAIVEFEKVAYQLNAFKDKQYQAKAGYAAIVSYQDYIALLTTDSNEIKNWQAQAVESMLRFAETFHQDKRSPSVLTNAAEYLFGLDQYQRALTVAEKLIQTNAALDPSLKKTALGIAAHSYFKLENYQQAEDNYLAQRNLSEQSSEEYQLISERLATAMYKRSDELIKLDNKTAAIEKLLKLKYLAPISKLRVSAQYNAATLLLATQQWQPAIDELNQLIKDYKQDELAPEFSRKLAFAYEKQESWHNAGDAYVKLSKEDKDPKVRQEALFIAAGLYEKNKNYNTALELYKQYARTYEKPFDVRMEARYHIAELYLTTQQLGKTLFWLRRIVAANKEAGSEQNDRSRWLAAWANAQYGDYYAEEFRKLKLTGALEKSLPKKNAMLKNATQRYEMASNSGILEFVTMSSVKIAQLYQQLVFDLRKIAPPAGLVSEEKAMYKEIIEEQAYPFEKMALELHLGNIERAWQGEYNQWIEQSFMIMKTLSPARFNKQEVEVSYGDEIR